MMSRQQKKVSRKVLRITHFRPTFRNILSLRNHLSQRLKIITIHPKSYDVHLKMSKLKFKFDLEFYEKAYFGSGGKTVRDGSRQYSSKMFI